MRTVLVVREGDVFSRILAANDFRVVNLPLIETKASEDLRDFETRLEKIENYDGIFLTSAKAAEIFRARLIEKKLYFHGSVYVLGRRSFDVLKTENLDLRYDAAADTAREMLEKIAPADLKSKRFLFVRGEKSLRVVPDFLSKNAATVDEAIVYRTESIEIKNDEIKTIGAKIESREIVCACFFSPSAGANFIEQFGAEILHQTRIATIGKTTAEFFERRNLTVDFISPKATAKDFAVELINFLRNVAREKNERDENQSREKF